MSVAEWNGNHGIEDIKLVDASNNDAVIDTLKFHTFESIVVGFSGETLGASWGIAIPYLAQPTYDIAVDFYNRGYDVHYYDVYDHRPSSILNNDLMGPAPLEVLEAIIYRKVTHVGAYGWSHGGGAVYLLMALLQELKQSGALTHAFTVDATAYIDAISLYAPLIHINPFAEGDRPALTNNHANWYQTTSGLPPSQVPWHGVSIPSSEIDDDLTSDVVMMPGQDHVNIAEIVAGIAGPGIGPWPKLLLDFFKQKMPTR